MFLALVARMARRGLIEVHAYCIMTTHFHMLVRSPQGRLSEAMQWIEDVFVRWYNRGRRRDGSLFRGRFESIPIRSNAHWEATLAYIDRNPIEAHIVTTASDYPWCSAYAYAHRTGPKWLSRVQSLVCERGCLSSYQPDQYDEIIGAGRNPSVAAWVERCMNRRATAPGDLDDLVAAAPEAVRAWMARKARLADGEPIQTALVSTTTLRAILDAFCTGRADWQIRVGRFRRSALQAMRTGLLRDVAAATLAEIAGWEQAGTTTILRRSQWHRRSLLSDDGYAATAVQIVADALAAEFPSRKKGVGYRTPYLAR